MSIVTTYSQELLPVTTEQAFQPVSPDLATEETVPEVDVYERAKYLGAALNMIEEAYSSHGNTKALRESLRSLPTNLSRAEAVYSSHTHTVNTLGTAKELFARGAGYSMFKNPDGTYPADVQDELDYHFVSFKYRYGGPDKANARAQFRDNLERVKDQAA